MHIFNIQEKYSEKINSLDLDLIIAHILKKPREFVLAHPEKSVTKNQESMINKLIKRRINHEPIAYILGEKEFYGLNFKVNKHTLIPRPETEHLVYAVISNLSVDSKTMIVDIGTGSGNIIISIAKELEKNYKLKAISYKLCAIDISEKALTVAKHNAKKNKVAKKIKFIKSDLLNCFFPKSYPPARLDSAKRAGEAGKLKANKLILVANLPYLSKKIYSSAMSDVKNFEPKSALLSGTDGLDHYEKLFQQIKNLKASAKGGSAFGGRSYQLKAILEISPEQKEKIAKLIKKYFPDATFKFQKDLAQKWRVAIFEI